MASKLKDSQIRALKPTGKVQKISDGGGLYLHVTEKGSKLWRMAYSFEGKQKLLSLGAYPEVSLLDARRRRDEAKQQLANGIDPSAEKKRIKLEARQTAEAASRTFRVVAAEFVETQENVWATNNIKKKIRLLNMLYDAFGDKPIEEVTPTDILAVARPLDACGKTVTAHTLVQTANQVCRFARACGYCVFNAADGLTSVLRPIQARHRPCITEPVEVGQLLRAIDEYKGSISVMWALRLLPYIPLRSTELRGAFWSEIDFENALWTVPATRAARPQDGGGMKMRQEHIVPLSTQVLQLFQELRNFNQPGPLCFPGRQSATQCISDVALLNSIRRMGYGRDEMCVHGFRGTFSTMLNEKKLEWGFDSDVIEVQLAHVEKNAVRSAYNHATYLEQRRKLMQRWADYLDELRA